MIGCGIGVTKANENGSSAAARSQTKYCKCHLPNCRSHHHGRRAQFYHQGVISMAWRTLWSNAAAVGNRHITLPFFACEGSARRHGQAQLIRLLAWQLWAKNDVKTSFSFTYKRASVMNHNGRRSGIVMAHTSWPEDLPHRPVWPNVRALHKAPAEQVLIAGLRRAVDQFQAGTEVLRRSLTMIQEEQGHSAYATMDA